MARPSRWLSQTTRGVWRSLRWGTRRYTFTVHLTVPAIWRAAEPEELAPAPKLDPEAFEAAAKRRAAVTPSAHPDRQERNP
ncbi:hypothetical protein ACT17_15185 [Mycolicibacterium conceptionense]|uniref:Uncharacterized protein n=1 Tax=Mycolicibacterium conceptionense TaxID=451644 RepID=A0A0J8U7X1_9MYCO|nr:hypothetical protein [Mycolicibacterium conceptionense]KMV17623.1 hypothetical protein ACT17_15185 [Mycolicibacterium conceptionense]